METRSYYHQYQLEAVFKYINERLTRQQATSKHQSMRALSNYPSIIRYARLTPNKVPYKSASGLGTRNYYTPRTIYGYTPDNVYSPFVLRVWISTKEIVQSIVFILESPEFNDKFGTFRAFDDTSFDMQWRKTFNIKNTGIYTTKHYRTMNHRFKNHYFPDVGLEQLNPKVLGENLEGDHTPLFLDIDFDSFLPESRKPKSDYSLDVMHFDMEATNQRNPVTGKVRFCVPYVDVPNLEKSVSKKVLGDDAQRYLEHKKKRMCPNCPRSYTKGHDMCKTCTPEEAEEIATRVYVKELTKLIEENPSLQEEFCGNVDASLFIPDPITGTDQIFTICFVLSNIRDMDVTHPCEAYGHYIYTCKPKFSPGWSLDRELFTGSKRLCRSEIVVFENELEMILAFLKKIPVVCPFKICGYNINGFDIPYLEYRIKWYRKYGTTAEKTLLAHSPPYFGLMKYYYKLHKTRPVFRPNVGQRMMTTTFLSVILSLDVLEGIGNETFSQPAKMASHKLNSVAAATLLYPGSTEPMLKVQLDVTEGARMWRAGGVEASNFMGYCIWDAILSLGLARLNAFDELADTISKLSNVPSSSVYGTGVREKILYLYHSYNASSGNRYLIPVEKGGLMMLMHHPDIWLFSPSRCHDEYLDEFPYGDHKTCPKTGLIIPNIFEVVERRKKESWKKGALRNFPKTEYTPKGKESANYEYSEKFRWLALKKDESEKDFLQDESTPMDLDEPSYNTNSLGKQRQFLEKKIRDLEETIEEFVVELKNLRGEAPIVKYARARAHFDMLEYQNQLRDVKKELNKVIIDENIAKNRSSSSHSIYHNASALGDLDWTPKKAKVVHNKQLKTMEKEAKSFGVKKKSDKKKAFMGGHVENMIRGYFEEFVIFSDFNSLYPSIMFSNFVDFATLLTAYVRTSVYPNISPLAYKKVILGPFRDIFSADYTYNPKLAKELNYDTPELAETSWIQDVDCLTTIIMNDLLALRGSAKNEMALQANGTCEMNFMKFLIENIDKKMSEVVKRLEDPKYLNEDYGKFGKESPGSSDVNFKARFLTKVNSLPLVTLNTAICLDIIRQLPSEIAEIILTTLTAICNHRKTQMIVNPTNLKEAFSLNMLSLEIVKIKANAFKNKEAMFFSRQNGIKVTMNSGYGFMGSGTNLSLQEGAGTITAVGRNQIQKVKLLVESLCVVKVLTRELGLGAYLITIGIHPAAFWPELMQDDWPPVTEQYLEAALVVCRRQKGLGGDTDSGFTMVSGTVLGIDNMNDKIYPTTFKDGQAIVDTNKEALTKYDIINMFADHQSLKIIQSFLPIEVLSTDTSKYDSLDRNAVDATGFNQELLSLILLDHKTMKRVAKQKMVKEKIASRFLGFGKKRYSYVNCLNKKLLHKGISLVRGDSIPWVTNILKREMNILFETDPNAKYTTLTFNGEEQSKKVSKISQMFLNIIYALEELALGKNFDISEFEKSQKLKKDTAHYSSDSPHVQVARKMIERGLTVGPQSTIRYVYYFRYGGQTESSKDDLGAKASTKIVQIKPGETHTDLKSKGQQNKKKHQSTQSNYIDNYFKPSEPRVKEKPSLRELDELASFDIGRLNMTQGKPDELVFPPNFKFLQSDMVTTDVDTATYIIDNNLIPNIPYYIKDLIIPALSLVLSVFISGNDEYPLVGDIYDKAKVAQIEDAQQKYCAEQKRQVSCLLWTDVLKERVDNMLAWFTSKTLANTGQMELLVTSRCLQCDKYFKYHQKTAKKADGKINLVEICPLCRKTVANLNHIKEEKKAALIKYEGEFLECLGKCETCFLRTEVGISPTGLVESGRLGETDIEDLLYDMQSSDSIVETLHKHVTAIPQMKKHARELGTSIVELNRNQTSHEADIIETFYPKSIWISNPFKCEYDDCKVHKKRRITELRYKQTKQSLASLDQLE